MKTECADLTTKPTTRFPVSDLGDGNERKSWTAARCLISDPIREVSAVFELRLLVAHFGRLAADALGFCDQLAHFTEQCSSALWVHRGL